MGRLYGKRPIRIMAAEARAMTAVFLIDRQLYYKFLAPVINEVLIRGIRVICLHNYSNERTRFSGPKADLFPSLAICPRFPVGMVEARLWRTQEDIAAVIESEGVGYVYALHGPSYYGLAGRPEREGVVWVQLQHGADSFLDGTDTDLADIFARYSPVWAEHFSRPSLTNGRDTGCPALNSVCYDPSSIRRKYALPPEKQVIVYFANDNPRLIVIPGALKRFWYLYIFNDDFWSGRWQGIAKLLSRITVTELTLVKELRAYASERGALLIIKSRSKRKLSPLMCSYADVVSYDESLYPSTNYELTAIASLLVCIASTAQLEAGFFGFPAISLYPGLLKAYFLSTIDRCFPGKQSRSARSVSEFVNDLRSGNLRLPQVTASEVSEIFGEHGNSAQLIVDLSMRQRRGSMSLAGGGEDFSAE